LKLIHKAGFTLIELLVALVVSGLLMASLVGISSAVQKSFGRSKDISELQANLRFAMKSIVQDFGRVGFMYSPDPINDMGHRGDGCNTILEAIPAIRFNRGLQLTGNFVSSRDYLYDPSVGRIFCRNGRDPLDSPDCSPAPGIAVEPYILPFADGPDFANVFCQNEMVRVDVKGRKYCYALVNQPNVANKTFSITPQVYGSKTQGDTFWINPVTTVTYNINSDLLYTARYNGNTNYNMRWMLNRATLSCQGNLNADLADFMLPPNDAQFPGLGIQAINDLNGVIGGQLKQPSFGATCTATEGSATCVFDPQYTRAVIITLRARTEMEDPDFTINNYNDTSPSRDIGIDLDQNPADGLAHVRTERTVVELRNLATNQSSF
jgi:prepilin-type N-terminal cleavage/methylation domain-containing protein